MNALGMTWKSLVTGLVVYIGAKMNKALFPGIALQHGIVRGVNHKTWRLCICWD